MQNNGINTRWFAGQGIFLVAELDANFVPLGFRNVGNVSALKLAVAVETVEKQETSTGQRATVLRMDKTKSATFDATIDHLAKENLAMVTRGTAAAVAAASVAGENVTARLGYTVPLANPSVSTVVVKGTDMTGNGGADNSAITYEEGKNYTVNTEAGSINILSAADQTAAGAASDIADADVLAVDYDFADYDKLDALTEGSKYYALRFEGLNTADENKPVIVDIYRVLADPLKEFDLINEDIGEFGISGSVIPATDKAVGSQFFTVKIVS